MRFNHNSAPSSEMGIRLSLPVTDLDGVDEVFAKALQKNGIHTVGDLAGIGSEVLVAGVPPKKLSKLRAKARLVTGFRPWLEPFTGLFDHTVGEVLAMSPGEAAALAGDPAVTAELAGYLQEQLFVLGAALDTKVLQGLKLSELKNPSSNYMHIGSVSGGLLPPVVSGDRCVIHVNPETGDDRNLGDAKHPLATLLEAGKRASSGLTEVVVELSAGTHVLADNASAGAGVRTLFNGIRKITLRGEARNTGQTITVVDAVDNVLTVEESLPPQAYVGAFITVHILQHLPPFQYWIIANDEHTVTLAASVSGLGGYFEFPKTGSYAIEELATKIVSSPVNPGHYENRFFYQGTVEMRNLHFDQTVHGGFAGVSSLSRACDLTLYSCKFTGWEQCLNAYNGSSVYASWFESGGSGQGYGYGALGYGFLSGDCVFKDLKVGIKAGDDLTLGRDNVNWDLGCYLYIEMDGHSIWDMSPRIWVDPGVHAAPNYVRLDGRGSQYLKTHGKLHGIDGHDTFNFVYKAHRGNNGFSLLDSAAAGIKATRAYVVTDDIELSLEDYVAGTTSGKPLRYSDDRGNVFEG